MILVKTLYNFLRQVARSEKDADADSELKAKVVAVFYAVQVTLPAQSFLSHWLVQAQL